MIKKLIVPSLLTVSLFAGLSLTSAPAAEESQASLKAEAKITRTEAQKTALAKVENGKIKSAEIEREHGKLIWSFDIAMPGTKNIKEVQVDAKTGKVVSIAVETPEDQAREANEDQAGKN